MSRGIASGGSVSTASLPNPTVSIVGTPSLSSPLVAAETGLITSRIWQRGATFGGGGSFATISGATGPMYQPVIADIGYSIRVVSTGPSASATSAPVISPVTPEGFLKRVRSVWDERGLPAPVGGFYLSCTDNGPAGVALNADSGFGPAADTTINGFAAPRMESVGRRFTSSASGKTLADDESAGAGYEVVVAQLTAAPTTNSGATSTGDGSLTATQGSAFELLNVYGPPAGPYRAIAWVFSSVAVATPSLQVATALNQPFLIERWRDGARCFLRVNGGAPVVTPFAANLGGLANTLLWGENSDASHSLDVAIGTSLRGNAIETDAAMADLRAWLSNKYGGGLTQ